MLVDSTSADSASRRSYTMLMICGWLNPQKLKLGESEDRREGFEHPPYFGKWAFVLKPVPWGYRGMIVLGISAVRLLHFTSYPLFPHWILTVGNPWCEFTNSLWIAATVYSNKTVWVLNHQLQVLFLYLFSNSKPTLLSSPVTCLSF